MNVASEHSQVGTEGYIYIYRLWSEENQVHLSWVLRRYKMMVIHSLQINGTSKWTSQNSTALLLVEWLLCIEENISIIWMKNAILHELTSPMKFH